MPDMPDMTGLADMADRPRIALSGRAWRRTACSPGASECAGGSADRLRPHELAQEARQVARFHLAQMCAEMRLDGRGIDRPHGAPQRAPLGGDEEDVVAAVKLTLVAFDEPLALQPVYQAAHVVLRKLGAILHACLAQHALWAAVDLIEHMVPVERRQARAFQVLLYLVAQRPLHAHEVGPCLYHRWSELGVHRPTLEQDRLGLNHPSRDPARRPGRRSRPTIQADNPGQQSADLSCQEQASIRQKSLASAWLRHICNCI